MGCVKFQTERRVFPAFLCFVLSLLLLGCEPRFDLTPATSSEVLPNPKFKVTDPDHPGERPLYNTIKLHRSDGTLLWHLRAEPFGNQNSVKEFSYGKPINGFTEVVPSTPLKPGESYTLYVLGGPTGSLRFQVDSNGRILIQ